MDDYVNLVLSQGFAMVHKQIDEHGSAEPWLRLPDGSQQSDSIVIGTTE